jgi:hypothetical protein
MPLYKITNSTVDPVPFKVLSGLGVNQGNNNWLAWLTHRQVANLRKLYRSRISIRKERVKPLK